MTDFTTIALASLLLLCAVPQQACSDKDPWSHEHGSRAFPGQQVEVVVAAAPIAVHAPLTPALLKIESVPERFLPPNPIRKEDMEFYMGKQFAVAVSAGTMVLTSDFATKDAPGSVSGRVPRGERALKLSIDAPDHMIDGDRVDIMGVFPVTDEADVEPNPKPVGSVAISLLQHVRVLSQGKAPVGDVEPGQQGHVGGSLTLSVTVEEANLLLLSQSRGKLTAMLRHADDEEIKSIERQTLKSVLIDLEIIAQRRIKRSRKERRVSGVGAAPGKMIISR